MAVELVRMDRSELNGAIYATADTVRDVYGALAEITMKPGYAAAGGAEYEWNAAAGYAGVIGDLMDSIAAEVSGSDSGITVKSGSVTLSSSRQTIDVTPAANRTPLFCMICKNSIAYNANATRMCAYLKLFSSLLMGSYVKDGYVGISARTQNNGASAIMTAPDSSVTWIGPAAGTVRFCGVSTYYFSAGDYTWYAFYGEVYGNDG